MTVGGRNGAAVVVARWEAKDARREVCDRLASARGLLGSVGEGEGQGERLAAYV